MPIYEYRCKSCGKNSDFLQKMSDPPKEECKHCDKPDMHKVISSCGFQLTGTGWYETDFKHK